MSLQSLTARPRSSSRSQHHAVICADCNESTTVPFRPSPSRPVYCRSCFNARRNGQSAKPNTLVSEPIGADDRFDEPAPDGVEVFSGMALRAATRQALSLMNISQPTPIQTKSHPTSNGGSRSDWTGTHRFRKDASVCSAAHGAVRPVYPSGSGARAPTHPRACNSGGRSHESLMLISTAARIPIVWWAFRKAGMRRVKEWSADHHWDPRAHARPSSAGNSRPALSAISRAGRGRRNAGQRVCARR